MSSSVKSIVRSYQNYINGQWVKSSSGEAFPVYDPSTEEEIARVFDLKHYLRNVDKVFERVFNR